MSGINTVNSEDQENIVASEPVSPLSATIAEGKQQGSFVLMLCGDRLTPFFNDGDMLTVDTTAQPGAFDAVVAELAGTGSYQCMLLDPDGGLWDMCGQRVAAGEYERVGVVVNRCSRRIQDRILKAAR